MGKSRQKPKTKSRSQQRKRSQVDVFLEQNLSESLETIAVGPTVEVRAYHAGRVDLIRELMVKRARSSGRRFSLDVTTRIKEL